MWKGEFGQTDRLNEISAQVRVAKEKAAAEGRSLADVYDELEEEYGEMIRQVHYGGDDFPPRPSEQPSFAV